MLLVLVGIIPSYAQYLGKSDQAAFDEAIKAGDFYRNQGEHLLASYFYEDARDFVRDKDSELLKRLADTYATIKDYHNAAKYYRKLSLSFKDDYPLSPYNHALALIQQARYVEAKPILIDFQVANSNNEEYQEMADLALANCKAGIYYMQNPIRVKIENGGFVFNSKYSEQNVSIIGEHNLMYNTQVKSLRKNSKSFKLKKIGDKGSDTVLVNEIYEAILEEDRWETKKYAYFPVLKGYTVEGSPYLSSSNTVLYVALRNNSTGLKTIHRTEKVAGVWTKLKPLSKEVNVKGFSSKDVMVVSKGDQEILYYASDRPGGEGGYDLWFAVVDWKGNYVDGGILKGLNTPGDELTPYFDRDAETLYFSSNGRTGLGGFDVYQSTGGIYGEWSSADNMGYPLNTSMDELGFVYSSATDRGYISSNRVGGLNESTSFFDIYLVSFNVEEKAIDFDVTLRLFDRQYKNKLGGASIEVFRKGEDTSLFKKKTNITEDLNFSLSNQSDYIIKIRRQKYLAMDLTVSVKKLTVISSAEKLTYFFSNDENSDEINALQTNVYMTRIGGPDQVIVKKPGRTIQPEEETAQSDESSKDEEVNQYMKSSTTEKVARASSLGNPSDVPECNEWDDDTAMKKIAEDFANNQIKGLLFHVQVGAYHEPRSQIFHFLKEVGSIGEEQHEGLYKYLLGGRNTLEMAKDFQVEIMNKGVKDAFIVPYFEGERIRMCEAYQIMRNN